MGLTPFHLAVQVRDIDEAREFYGVKLGFPQGRSADAWIDFDMFGHQFVTHFNSGIGKRGKIPSISNLVDGQDVPVPHFGVVLRFTEWEVLAAKVRLFIEREFLTFPPGHAPFPSLTSVSTQCPSRRVER